MLAFAVLAFGACAGQGSGSGCGALTPIPDGFAGPKTNNAVNLRLTAQGINTLNTNWRKLVETFAPGGRLEIPISCAMKPGKTDSFLHFADQGTPGCTSTSCGRGDGVCTTDPSSAKYDAPITLTVDIIGFDLLQRAPDLVEVSVSLALDTGDIIVGAGCAYCSVRFNATANAPTLNTFRAQVKLLVDTRWDQILSIDIPELDGTQICGGVGSPLPPLCLDVKDLSVTSLGGVCSDAACTAVDWFRDSVLQMLSPFIHDVIRNTIKKQDCEPCDSTDRACPSVATGATSRCNFSKNVCIDDDTGACVPRLLGVEGRVSLGTLLAKYGAPPSAALDLSVGAGGTAKVGTGIDLGTRAGIYAVQVDTCVAPVPPPALPDVPAPDFDAIAGGSGYHAAVSISQPFLALAFHHVQQAGGLCVTIDSTQVPTLNSGLLKTFLPSLGPLVERDGKAAPMKLVLRPGAPPEVAIGEGTYDPVTKKAIKPLLTLTLRDLALDFYAQLDDRDVRLFSITADVAIPLSLIVEDCSSVRPALGDLSGLVTRVKSTESALLAEDPKVLADLVPIGVGMAEPMLATALTAFSLPTAGNFKLQVNAIHGVSPIPGTDQYFHVGFFGTLVDAAATCTAPVAGFSAGLAGTPTTLSKMGWPTVKLSVGGEASAPVSYSVRVDDGFWSDFLPADADRSLSVSHPALLADGPHRISVRARSGEASSDGKVLTVPVKIDRGAPELFLASDAEGRLIARATDAVWPAGALRLEASYGDDAPVPLSNGAAIDLAALGDRALTVRAIDPSGNVAERRRPAAVISSPRAIDAGAGCTVGGAGEWLPALGLLAVLRRRRAR